MGGSLTFNDNDDVQLKGATDGTLIGNVSDSLKVAASIVMGQKITPVYAGSKLRLLDMNVANGGVARGTSVTTAAYTTLFNYSGTGQLFSFLVTMEGNLTGGDAWVVRLDVDGVTCFEVNTADLGTNTIYNLIIAGAENSMGFSLESGTLRFASPGSGAFNYTSNISIFAKKAVGGSKLFRAGLVYATKDT